MSRGRADGVTHSVERSEPLRHAPRRKTSQGSAVGGDSNLQNERRVCNLPFAQPSKGTHTATLFRGTVMRAWKVGLKDAAETQLHIIVS